MTIDLITNAMTLTEVVLYILQGPSEGTLNFETLFDQAIRNISKDINATTKILNTKAKKTRGKPRRTKVGVKATRKEVMKKRTKVIKKFSSSNNELSLAPLEEEFYTMLEANLKMTNNLFALQKPNGKFLTQLCISPFFFPFQIYLLIRFLCFFKLLELFKTARYDHFCT